MTAGKGNKMLNILSGIPESVELTLDTTLIDNLEYCNFVYMCIKEPNSFYRVPDNIFGILEPILNIVSNEQTINQYCYVTIKKMFVQPNTFGNREGWHIDGFLGGDQINFIWSNSLPTEVALGVFNLSEDHHKSLLEMNEQVKENIFLQTNTLYKLDQTCIHRPSINTSNQSVLRTFIKVTFSSELFNGFGNAWNYKLPHIKPTKNRAESRNHGTMY